MMSSDSILNRIVSVIGDLGGSFTFLGADGHEYIVLSKSEMQQRLKQASEQQLNLLSAEKMSTNETADSVLEKINRDIAVYQLLQQEQTEDVDDDYPGGENIDDLAIFPPGKKVRFEPLRGDLPPELQG